jgi:hypothetical protein
MIPETVVLVAVAYYMGTLLDFRRDQPENKTVAHTAVNRAVFDDFAADVEDKEIRGRADHYDRFRRQGEVAQTTREDEGEGAGDRRKATLKGAARVAVDVGEDAAESAKRTRKNRLRKGNVVK